jgi:phosphoribosyl 1,2-cyclic phosphate phosphodiesterase
MKVTILGCGGSGGVPLITGDWGHCNPNNPKNRRRRVSVLVEQGDTRILIDTSPDLRAQFLDAGVTKLDAVLYTHEHADHCHGIDELRAFGHAGRHVPIPAYGTAETLALLQQRFGYIFEQPKGGSGSLYRPLLQAQVINGSFTIAGVLVRPFVQDHGFGATTTGYRLGRMAYSTDVVDRLSALRAAPDPRAFRSDDVVDRPGQAAAGHPHASQPHDRLRRPGVAVPGRRRAGVRWADGRDR